MVFDYQYWCCIYPKQERNIIIHVDRSRSNDNAIINFVCIHMGLYVLCAMYFGFNFVLLVRQSKELNVDFFQNGTISNYNQNSRGIFLFLVSTCAFYCVSVRALSFYCMEIIFFWILCFM